MNDFFKIFFRTVTRESARRIGKGEKIHKAVGKTLLDAIAITLLSVICIVFVFALFIFILN